MDRPRPRRAQPSGHARLVHARLAGLSFSDWPSPQASDIARTAPEIVEELDVARQVLDRAPRGEKALLYRLSIVSGAFRRDHAVQIGNISPALSFPGDIFDRLVGPWIDKISRHYYRLSPLLNHAAVCNWTQERINELRRDIANAILKCGELTLHEANEVLFQGLISNNENIITRILPSLANPSAEQLEPIAQALSWVPLLGRRPGEKAFEANSYLNFLLRILQFRVLVVQNPSEIDGLCAIVDSEYAELDSEVRVESRLMWLTVALIYYQANIAPKRLLAYWVEARELVSQKPEFREFSDGIHLLPRLPDLPPTDHAGHWLMMILAREMTSTTLIALVDAVNELPAVTKKEVVDYFRKMPYAGRLAVERTWFHGAEGENPDWNAIIGGLKRFQESIVDWNLPAFDVYVACGVATIEDEYRNNPVEAISVLDDALKTQTQYNYLLLHQKAFVLYRQERYDRALAIWQSILPIWPVIGQSSDRTVLYASQRAAHSAGKIGDWPAALEILARATEFAQVLKDELSIATFRADESHALWKNGKRPEALGAIAGALVGLECLTQQSHSRPQLHRARKCVEQVVKWFRFESGAGVEGSEWEPPAALCSSVEYDEKLKAFEACPFEFLWYYLADTEAHLKLGDVHYNAALARVPASKLAAFRGFMSVLAIRRSFRCVDFTQLVEYVAAGFHSMLDSKAQESAGRRVFDDDAFACRSDADPAEAVGDGIIGALIVLAATGRPLGTFITAWRRAAAKLPNHDATFHILDVVQSTLNANKSELDRIYRASMLKVARCVAAVRLSCDPEQSADSVFAGQVLVTAFVLRGPFRDELELVWGEGVRREWLRRIAFPARFSAPSRTIAPIEIACRDESHGLKLAARILLAARAAVSPQVDPQVISAFEEIAAG